MNAVTPLRWAQGQGEHGRGTRWHVVVEDVYDNPERTGFPLQRTACGRTILQSTDLQFDDWRVDYLDNGSPPWDTCPRLQAGDSDAGRGLARRQRFAVTWRRREPEYRASKRLTWARMRAGSGSLFKQLTGAKGCAIVVSCSQSVAGGSTWTRSKAIA